ncbi:MAG: PD-(D/E)XK nuclease family protein [Leptolinea sp.]|nr:PD-(D/E)XK nuclease family protein [Leptolinea sp.]
MTLSPDFVFTQNNLQDFEDCPRRFQLKYLLRMAWPAPISEPIEENDHLIRLGSLFHQMVHQYYLNVPEEKIASNITDEDLLTWWKAFLMQSPVDLPKNKRPEIEISMPFNNFRLAAKIDLLSVERDKKAVIVDWKTSHRPPRPAYITSRIQSLVYPYLVISTGSTLNYYRPFKPDQVTMIYWYPAFPDSPVVLTFSAEWMEKTINKLTRLVDEIVHLDLEVFPLTSDQKKCQFCRYRSLCDRGISAGHMDDMEEDDPEENSSLKIDFDEIEETPF